MTWCHANNSSYSLSLLIVWGMTITLQQSLWIIFDQKKHTKNNPTCYYGIKQLTLLDTSVESLGLTILVRSKGYQLSQ
jgi:hypothetical protein